MHLHKNACKIKLHLETNIHVGAIDCWTPPKGESSIRYLIETGTLGIGEFLVSHRLFKSRSLFPEET